MDAELVDCHVCNGTKASTVTGMSCQCCNGAGKLTKALAEAKKQIGRDIAKRMQEKYGRSLPWATD